MSPDEIAYSIDDCEDFNRWGAEIYGHEIISMARPHTGGHTFDQGGNRTRINEVLNSRIGLLDCSGQPIRDAFRGVVVKWGLRGVAVDEIDTETSGHEVVG